MKCDGSFYINETHVVDDKVQELYDVSLNLDVLRPLFVIPESASDTSFYMILGNEVMPKLDVHDENLTTGDKENEEPENEDDTDTSQMESEQEERPFRSRRHKKDPVKWKQNIRKWKRNADEEYLSCKTKDAKTKM